MTLVRYNPWQEMYSLQRQLNRLFDDALTPANWDGFDNLARIPAAELTQTDDAVHLKLEVPGIEAKDLNIQAMADRVAISGERKSEINEKTRLCGAVSFRTEFRYGKFSRVIPLPVKIKNTNVTADYKNGILNLTLPKPEEEKNKVVKVNLLQEETAE